MLAKISHFSRSTQLHIKVSGLSFVSTPPCEIVPLHNVRNPTSVGLPSQNMLNTSIIKA